MVVVGYLAFGLNVAGNLLLAHKNILGWIEAGRTKAFILVEIASGENAILIGHGGPINYAEMLGCLEFAKMDLYAESSED